MRYLDTNVIIYAIENHPKYGEACKKILEGIQENRLKVGASLLVLVEVINVLKKLERRLNKKLDIRKNIDAILSLPIVWFDLNFVIIRRAAEYDFPITGIDHVHVATMEINSIREIISADSELDKAGIKRVDPIELR